MRSLPKGATAKSIRSPPLQPEWCQSIDRAAVLIWSQGAAKEREISGCEESPFWATFFASSQNSQRIGSAKENFNYKSSSIFDHFFGPSANQNCYQETHPELLESQALQLLLQPGGTQKGGDSKSTKPFPPGKNLTKDSQVYPSL